MREWLRQARFIRAALMLARSQPQAALAGIDEVLAEAEYPKTRVANRLAAMVTLKSRAELATGSPGPAALASARDALSIAEATSLKPDQSADVGAALMAVAAAQRAIGDVAGAHSSASRAAVALANGLGPSHSETRAALEVPIARRARSMRGPPPR